MEVDLTTEEYVFTCYWCRLNNLIWFYLLFYLALPELVASGYWNCLIPSPELQSALLVEVTHLTSMIFNKQQCHNAKFSKQLLYCIQNGKTLHLSHLFL